MIPLQVQAPQIDSPLKSLGGLMQLRQGMTEMALHQAQIEQAKQATQNLQAEQTQKNLDLTDQNTLSAKEKDPEFMKRLYSGDISSLSGLGLQDKTVQALNTHINDTIAKKATTDTATLANQKAASEEVGRSLDSLTQMRTPDDKLDLARVNESLSDLTRRLSPQLRILGVDPSQIPTAITDESQLQTIAARNNALQSVITSANSRKKEQAATAESAGKAAQAQAEADFSNYKLSMLKGNATNTATDSALLDKLFAGRPDLRAQADAQYAAGKAAKPLEPGAGVDAAKAFYDEQVGKPAGAAATYAAETPLTVKREAALEPGKIRVAAAGATARADAAGLTEDDYQRAGEQYARTGVMPAMGRDSVTRGRIVHAANEFARDNGLSPQDVTTMQAAFAGDKESLKKFQGQRDQIVSFENTAKKNLDLFVGTAQKIVDSGSPWINKPLREIDQKALGSTDIAAVNAARQVANNEIAKVTSGGGLSGVLSDSARHEVEGYNPANATLAQTLAVAKVLRQDMANRHSSMDTTLGEIKGRIGGGSANTSTPDQKIYKNYNPKTGRIE